MSTRRYDKLNRLLANWAPGTIKTAKKLVQMGYSHRQLSKYVESGWIKSVGIGAFAMQNEPIQWPGGIYALQQDLGLPIHIGGLSALSIHGIMQYVAFNECLSLYNTSQTKKNIPKWFDKVEDNFDYHQYHLFVKNNLGFTTHTINNVEIIISKPERALLECLVLVPHAFQYQHMSELVDGARLLEPDTMQALLEDCRSIKTKRLFLYLAELHQLPCFSHLNIEPIDLGAGKRKIGEGGLYSDKYLISVPRTEDDQGGSAQPPIMHNV